MTKFMTTDRKITAARIAGASVGVGIMATLTKNLVTVLPVAGIAVAGIAILHRKMKNMDKDETVSVGDLAGVAAKSAAEVVLAGHVVNAAKGGIDYLRNRNIYVDPVVEIVATEE